MTWSVCTKQTNLLHCWHFEHFTHAHFSIQGSALSAHQDLHAGNKFVVVVTRSSDKQELAMINTWWCLLVDIAYLPRLLAASLWSQLTAFGACAAKIPLTFVPPSLAVFRAPTFACSCSRSSRHRHGNYQQEHLHTAESFAQRRLSSLVNNCVFTYQGTGAQGCRSINWFDWKRDANTATGGWEWGHFHMADMLLLFFLFCFFFQVGQPE